MQDEERTAILADHYLKLIDLLRHYQGAPRFDMDLAAVALAAISIQRRHEADISAIAAVTGIPRETVRRKIRALEREHGYLVKKRGGRTILVPAYSTAAEFVERAMRILHETSTQLNELKDEIRTPPQNGQ